MIKQYPSIWAMREDWLKHNGPKNYTYGKGNDHWCGGETAAQTFAWSETGQQALVPQAEDLLAKLDTQISTKRRDIIHSPAGGWPDVPAYLAGRPLAMKRIAHAQDERAPITILAVTTSSAGVDAEVLHKRGTVILALVMAMARIRPVSLHQVTLLDGPNDRTGETILAAQINTAPLDLATACYVLTSQGWARRLCMALAEDLNGFTGGWSSRYNFGAKQQKFFEDLKAELSPDPARTLLIGPAALGDKLLTNPVAWVNEQIEFFTKDQEEEE